MTRTILAATLIAVPALACNADEYASRKPQAIVTIVQCAPDETMQQSVCRPVERMATSCDDAFAEATEQNRAARSRGIDASIFSVTCRPAPDDEP